MSGTDWKALSKPEDKWKIKMAFDPKEMICRVERLPIQENLKFHVVTDQSHAYDVSSEALRDG